ncbi:SDR family NAD(P)-dependent oxidoreductase [Sphingomonas sp. 28-63-12]|uniref:SDR family NAD(P)-dependent oxidoreductase n=1 Tax=Sphingomonas sp. 28-63-12 TaxID=1970434 RepID=UPI000BCBFF4E|nr:MAG: oxidoreductase [Sphingomonas sp. 28-63-12]
MRIVVTGAASGIGRAVAEQLFAGRLIAGDHRVLLVDRDAAGLDAVARALGPHAAVLVADVLADTIGDQIVDAARVHMGGIDGVASNAGIIGSGSLNAMTIADYDRIFGINTRANWLIAQAVFPLLKENGGSFVATASMSAHQPTPGLSAYSASKAALLMLVRQLSVEWGPEGVRCNSVSPGPTMTPMTAGGYADADRKAQREASIPLRKLGSAVDIANAILFLLSDYAIHINGIDVLVDGGMSNNLMGVSGAGTGQTPQH